MSMLQRRSASPTEGSVTTDLPVFEVELPSLGVFYKEKKKSVKVTTLGIGQVRQLKAIFATQHESVRERAMLSVIDKSIVDFNALDLTEGDYKFLLYWIRLNTYKKTPFTITYTDPDTNLPSAVVVNQTMLDITEVDPAAWFDPKFGYTTMRDKILMLEMADEGERYSAFQASYLSGSGSLQERITEVEKKPADFVVEIREHANKFYHGVAEYIVVRPATEGTKEVRVTIELSLTDFFP